MILLTRGEQGKVYVTATERAVLSPTSFSMTFVHDLTKKVVAFPNVADASTAPERYNLFLIDIAAFDEADNGFFSYEVTDQDGNVLEIGKAKLVGDKPNITQYQDTPTEYETYGE